jgi:hypothetical protein
METAGLSQTAASTKHCTLRGKQKQYRQNCHRGENLKCQSKTFLKVKL